jgi:hypothetical protein
MQEVIGSTPIISTKGLQSWKTFFILLFSNFKVDDEIFVLVDKSPFNSIVLCLSGILTAEREHLYFRVQVKNPRKIRVAKHPRSNRKNGTITHKIESGFSTADKTILLVQFPISIVVFVYPNAPHLTTNTLLLNPLSEFIPIK